MAPHERNNRNNKMAKFWWICKTMQNQSIEMVSTPPNSDQLIQLIQIG